SRDARRAYGRHCRTTRPCRHPNDRKALRAPCPELRRRHDPRAFPDAWDCRRGESRTANHGEARLLTRYHRLGAGPVCSPSPDTSAPPSGLPRADPPASAVVAVVMSKGSPSETVLRKLAELANIPDPAREDFSSWIMRAIDAAHQEQHVKKLKLY